MSTLSPSMLSASASEFVPLAFMPVTSKDLAVNTVTDPASAAPKPKKSKEMRGPRRRHKKTKGDNCSVTTSISHSQHDEEDDAISYLSLEGSCPGEYYDSAGDGVDNLSYNNVSYPNLNYINDQINPLARQRWLNSPASYHSPAKMTSLRRDNFGRIYEEYTASPAEFENEFLTGAHSAAEGDWSHWFDNVCEQFGRSSSPDNLSLPYLFKKRQMQKRTPSECSQDSWLDLQQVPRICATVV
jgi:hypothetical protein